MLSKFSSVFHPSCRVLALALALAFFSFGVNLFHASTPEGKQGLLALGSEAHDFALTDVVSGQMSLVPVTGKDVRAAIDEVLAGRPIPAGQKSAMGCSVKWKPGNQPAYMKN